MLEVNHDIVQKIARMRCHHSWAKRLMLLPVEEADKAEAKVLDWIEEVVKEEAPTWMTEDEIYSAGRMVRNMWLHLLENEAIDMFLDKHPAYNRAIPLIISPGQAVLYAEADQNWPDKVAGYLAESVLEKIQNGTLKPDINYVLGRSSKKPIKRRTTRKKSVWDTLNIPYDQIPCYTGNEDPEEEIRKALEEIKEILSQYKRQKDSEDKDGEC